MILVVGAQKLVADLPAALRRVREHALPLENVRAQQAYGRPSAVSAHRGRVRRAGAVDYDCDDCRECLADRKGPW